MMMSDTFVEEVKRAKEYVEIVKANSIQQLNFAEYALKKILAQCTHIRVDGHVYIDSTLSHYQCCQMCGHEANNVTGY